MDEETSKQRKGYSFAELLEFSHLYRVEVDLRDWYFRTHYLTFRSFTERLDHQDAIDHLPKLENSPHLPNDRIFRLYSFGFLERELGSRLLYTDIMVDRNCKLRSVGPPFWKTLCNTYHPPTDDSREHIIQYPLDFNMCKFSRHVASNSFYYSQESRLMRLVDEVPLDKRRIQCLVNIDPLVPENITVCPGNERLFAFVADRNVHVSTGAVPVTLEHSSSRQSWSYGLPPYIIREEFNRHEGFWWSPTSNGNEYFLLVEGYNDKMLPSIVLSDCTMSPDKFECLRYAFAGGPNPKWCVKVYSVIFKYRASFPDVEVWERSFPERLIKLVPWAEYLVNAGWLPDGSAIWLKVMDRLQRRVSIICIPLEWFLPNDCADNNDVRKADAQKHLVFLYTEESDTWIPNHFGIKFLTPVSPDTVRFIWCSWKTDYRHLYLVESRRTASVEENFDTPTLDITPTVLSEKQLTFGQWDVFSDMQVSVDEKRSLIYFLGFADNPLESHLYATSYICPTTKPIRISTLGSFYGNTDEGNPFGFSNDYTLLAVFRSNFVTPGECVIYALKFETFFSNDLKYVLPSAASHLIISVAPYPAMNGVCPLPPPGRIFHESIWSRFTSEVSPPQLLECEGPDGGYQLQCMLFTPSNVAVATPRPTILFVYGGPCAQMVRNCWPTFLCLPLFMKMGYVVLVVDGRGSAYRGKQLEIAIGGRMGCVEIEDQVHALRYVASQNKCIDMKRVVVMGWSYGGYLAINALAKHPNIFKIAISGAPVVDWHLYDSAYTERYMGMPEEHVDNYDKASLLNSISLLPDEPNRLLLMHGLKDQNVHFKHTALLIEKMISAGKPYQLKIFPNERHGLRRATAIEHMSATILHFLQENL